GLIAWAPSFMERVHGFSVGRVGREFGIWGLAGGALGGLFGGRVGDWLLGRWPGGRVVVSGAGFVLGGPVCAALLLVEELGRFGLRPAMLLLPSAGLVGGLVILVALRTVARDMARVKA